MHTASDVRTTSSPSAATVLVFAVISTVATGAGGLPFLFVSSAPARCVGLANGVAAGLMLAASLVMLLEGRDYGAASTATGFALGIAFIQSTRSWLASHQHLLAHAHAKSAEADTRAAGDTGMRFARMVLIVAVFTIHSFAEGVALGVSFAGSEGLGVFMAVAIALHNIPEGLAVCLAMLPSGQSPLRAIVWSIFTSAPQSLMAVPAFLFVEQARAALPAGLGFSAGAMVAVALTEMIPESLAVNSPSRVAAAVLSPMLLALWAHRFASS